VLVRRVHERVQEGRRLDGLVRLVLELGQEVGVLGLVEQPPEVLAREDGDLAVAARDDLELPDGVDEAARRAEVVARPEP
jgi:hypothetical protein